MSKSLWLTAVIAMTAFAGTAGASPLPEPEQVWLDLGGWSHHSTIEGDQYHYNENHMGAGVTALWPEAISGLRPLGSIWYMKDSHGENLWQFGTGLNYALWGDPEKDWLAVDVSFQLGWVSRHERTYLSAGTLGTDTHRIHTVAIVPYLGVTISGATRLEFTYIPESREIGAPSSVWFARIAIKLPSL